MSKKSAFFLAGIIIIVIISAGVFYYTKNQNNEKKGGETVHRQQNNESSGEIDTTDWQTYRNEEYGFEFKYPEDWTRLENEEADRAWRLSKIDWKVETKDGKEYVKSFSGSDRLFYVVEVKSLPKDQSTGCSSGGPGVNPDGIQIAVSVKKAEGETYDNIIKKCDIISESGKCDTRIVDSSSNQMLVIDSPHSSCSIPSAYLLKGDLLYSISSDWSNTPTSDMKLYKDIFYSFVGNFILN